MGEGVRRVVRLQKADSYVKPRSAKQRLGVAACLEMPGWLFEVMVRVESGAEGHKVRTRRLFIFPAEKKWPTKLPVGCISVSSNASNSKRGGRSEGEVGRQTRNSRTHTATT